MKQAILGALAVAALLGAAFSAFGWNEASAQQRVPSSVPGQVVGGGDLIIVPMAIGDKGQVLSVVDPHQRVLCVYRIDPVSGKIALKSVRNLNADFQLSYLNNEAPLPQEIHSLLENK
jgi:hypothetical protein